MGWIVRYNDVGNGASGSGVAWDVLNIEGITSEAVMADDGETIDTTRNELRGTACISGASDTELEDKIFEAQTRLGRNGKILFISAGGSPTEAIADIDEGDETMGGPICKSNITRIAGTLTALIGFSIVWHDYRTLTEDPDEGEQYHVMSHWWTQSFTIEEDGRMRHIVNGALRVRSNAPDGPDGTIKAGPNVDRYRCLLMPALPGPGFRQKRAEFVIDKTGQRIVYTIENEEYLRALPNSAKIGEGRFIWKRSIESGPGLLGVKIFEATLEGDGASSPANLLSDLIRISTRRIIYAPTAGGVFDRILEIGVEEEDIFTKLRMTFRVVAHSVGGSAAVQPPQMTGPGFRVTDDFMRDIANLADRPDPYGYPLIRAVRRTLFDPIQGYTLLNFPKSAVEDALPCTVVETTRPLVGFGGISAVVPGGQQVGAIQNEAKQFPYLNLSMRERVEVNSNMLHMPAQTLVGESRVFQIRKPTVLLTTEYRITRHGKAPARILLEAPAGALVLHESWHVMPARLDSNNNRSFTAIYNRVLEVGDLNQSGMWVNDISSVAGPGITVRRFRPPNGIISFPHEPQTEPAANAQARTIFDTFDTVFDFQANPTVYLT